MKNISLQIAFPRSSEDRRLQLVGINGSIFAIVHSPLESDGPIQLFCEDWTLVLLAPIKSKSDIVISATNVICLSEIESQEGVVNLQASHRLMKFAYLTKFPNKIYVTSQEDHQFDDDPLALLYHHRLFTYIVSNIHSANPDSFSEAQEKFIMSLCTLAAKVDGKTDDLDLRRVLELWRIPLLAD